MKGIIWKIKTITRKLKYIWELEGDIELMVDDIQENSNRIDEIEYMESEVQDIRYELERVECKVEGIKDDLDNTISEVEDLQND